MVRVVVLRARDVVRAHAPVSRPHGAGSSARARHPLHQRHGHAAAARDSLQLDRLFRHVVADRLVRLRRHNRPRQVLVARRGDRAMTLDLPVWAALPAALLLIAGGILTLIGALGLVRLRDFYSRMHAPTMGTTLGTG